MIKKQKVFILAGLAVFLLSYGLWHFVMLERKSDGEIGLFEKKSLYPEIALGYAKGNFYAPFVTLKPDLAYFYRDKGTLEVNQVALEGVWLINRDSLSSLGDSSELSVKIDSERLFITLSGKSELPIRYELNGKPAGSFKVDDQDLRSYELTGVQGIYFPKNISLFIPRGIVVYALSPE